MAFLLRRVGWHGNVWSTCALGRRHRTSVRPPAWPWLVLVVLALPAVSFSPRAAFSASARRATRWLRAAGGRSSLDDGWGGRLHHRFGTPWRSIDALAVVQIAVVLVSGGKRSGRTPLCAGGGGATVLKLAACALSLRFAPEHAAYFSCAAETSRLAAAASDLSDLSRPRSCRSLGRHPDRGSEIRRRSLGLAVVAASRSCSPPPALVASRPPAIATELDEFHLCSRGDVT